MMHSSAQLLVLAVAIAGCSFTIPDPQPHVTGAPRPACTDSAPGRIAADATAGVATGAFTVVGLFALKSGLTDDGVRVLGSIAVVATAVASLTSIAAVATGLSRTSRCEEAKGAWVTEQREVAEACQPVVDRWFAEQDARRRDQLHAGMSRECRAIVDVAVAKVRERRRW